MCREVSLVTQRSHWAVCMVFRLAVAVVCLCMAAQTASARKPLSQLEDIVNSPFFPFTDRQDMEAINDTCRLLLSMLERELDIGADAGEIKLLKELLAEVAAFTSTEIVKGESYSIVTFAQSDDTALWRLRREVLLPAPPGGAIVRVYLFDEIMPLPIRALFQEQQRGITIGGRFVAVRAANMSREEREAVISHELVHAYINSYLGPDSNKLPRWFHEGVALYLPDVRNVYRSYVGIDVSPKDYREYRAVFRYLDSKLGRLAVARFIYEVVELRSTDEPLYDAIGTASYYELRNLAERPRWWPDVSKWGSDWMLWKWGSDWMLWGSVVLFALLIWMVVREMKPHRKEEEALTLVEQGSALAKEDKRREAQEEFNAEPPADRAWPDPTNISVEGFLATVEEIEQGYSGSGGYFLGEEEIEWILKAEASLWSRGMEVPGAAKRLRMIGDSYMYMGGMSEADFFGKFDPIRRREHYRKALEFFTRTQDFCRAEEALWLLEHADLTPPYHVRGQEFPGAIPCTSSETARLETPRYTFIAFFKGPLYRYDKQRNAHAIIFKDPVDYNYTRTLAWKDPYLEFKTEKGKQYRFNVETSYLELLPGIRSQPV